MADGPATNPARMDEAEGAGDRESMEIELIQQQLVTEEPQRDTSAARGDTDDNPTHELRTRCGMKVVQIILSPLLLFFFPLISLDQLIGGRLGTYWAVLWWSLLDKPQQQLFGAVTNFRWTTCARALSSSVFAAFIIVEVAVIFRYSATDDLFWIIRGLVAVPLASILVYVALFVMGNKEFMNTNYPSRSFRFTKENIVALAFMVLDLGAMMSIFVRPRTFGLAIPPFIYDIFDSELWLNFKLPIPEMWFYGACLVTILTVSLCMYVYFVFDIHHNVKEIVYSRGLLPGAINFLTNSLFVLITINLLQGLGNPVLPEHPGYERGQAWPEYPSVIAVVSVVMTVLYVSSALFYGTHVITRTDQNILSNQLDVRFPQAYTVLEKEIKLLLSLFHSFFPADFETTRLGTLTPLIVSGVLCAFLSIVNMYWKPCSIGWINVLKTFIFGALALASGTSVLAVTAYPDDEFGVQDTWTPFTVLAISWTVLFVVGVAVICRWKAHWDRYDHAVYMWGFLPPTDHLNAKDVQDELRWWVQKAPTPVVYQHPFSWVECGSGPLVGMEPTDKKPYFGSTFTVATTWDASIVTCGANDKGQLGHADGVYRFKFEEVIRPFWTERRLVQAVACGAEHCLVLTVDREVFGFGAHTSGQLATPLPAGSTRRLSTASVTQSAPMLIKDAFPAHRIACGALHSVVTKFYETPQDFENDTHQVRGWAFGDNSSGQCGLTPPEAARLEERLAQKAEQIARGEKEGKAPDECVRECRPIFAGDCTEQFGQVACGRRHTVFSTRVLGNQAGDPKDKVTGGKIWTMGCNEWGQLGRPANSSRSLEMVDIAHWNKYASNEAVCIAVGAGGCHSGFVLDAVPESEEEREAWTNEARLYMCGMGNAGQLGIRPPDSPDKEAPYLGEPMRRYAPIHVELPDHYSEVIDATTMLKNARGAAKPEKKMTMLKAMPPHRVSCGFAHTAVLTRRMTTGTTFSCLLGKIRTTTGSRCWTFGRNTEWQLGRPVPDRSDEGKDWSKIEVRPFWMPTPVVTHKPTDNASLLSEKDFCLEVHDIGVGASHTALVMWGSADLQLFGTANTFTGLGCRGPMENTIPTPVHYSKIGAEYARGRFYYQGKHSMEDPALDMRLTKKERKQKLRTFAEICESMEVEMMSCGDNQAVVLVRNTQNLDTFDHVFVWPRVQAVMADAPAVECCLCTEPFTVSGARQRRILRACGHTYCAQCLFGLSKANDDGGKSASIVCPRCRSTTVLFDGDVLDEPEHVDAEAAKLKYAAAEAADFSRNDNKVRSRQKSAADESDVEGVEAFAAEVGGQVLVGIENLEEGAYAEMQTNVTDQTKPPTFFPIKSLSQGYKITQVSCGWQFSCFIGTKGGDPRNRLWTMGRGMAGCLGLGRGVQLTRQLQEVTFYENGEAQKVNVRQVAAGRYHTCIIAEGPNGSGELWTCGSDGYKVEEEVYNHTLPAITGVLGLNLWPKQRLLTWLNEKLQPFNVSVPNFAFRDARIVSCLVKAFIPDDVDITPDAATQEVYAEARAAMAVAVEKMENIKELDLETLGDRPQKTMAFVAQFRALEDTKKRHAKRPHSKARPSGYGAQGDAPERDHSRWTPQRVQMDEDFVQISAGMAHTVAVTKDGDMYSFGLGYFGQLGPRADQAKDVTAQNFDVPTKIDLGGSKGDEGCCCPTGARQSSGKFFVKQAEAGLLHTVVLHKDGFQCLAFGLAGQGQCGIGPLHLKTGRTQEHKEVHVRTPEPVKFADKNTKVVKIACGLYQTAFLDSTGKVYTTGSHLLSSLGLGEVGFSQFEPRVVGGVMGRRNQGVALGSHFGGVW